MRGIHWRFQILNILKNEKFSFDVFFIGWVKLKIHFLKKRLEIGQKIFHQYFFLIFSQLSKHQRALSFRIVTPYPAPRTKKETINKQRKMILIISFVINHWWWAIQPSACSPTTKWKCTVNSASQLPLLY